MKKARKATKAPSTKSVKKTSTKRARGAKGARQKSARTAAGTSKKVTGGAKRAARNASAHVMNVRRPDFGAPIDGFFAKQPPHLRPILEELRRLVEEAAPDAAASIKWGMPFYSVGDTMMCALGGHKSHVNLILSGPPGAFADAEGRLEGAGKTGRHLTLRSLDALPRQAVRVWLRTAVKLARAKP